ncbi:hypothetical protein B0H13DRAFT_2008213 [Mycena leptocephala]|nr:hypothetical protein B0H13DRAFT_2008213 [Mycena leptocephala]
MPLFLSPHLSLVTLPVGLPMLLVFGHSSPSRATPGRSSIHVTSPSQSSSQPIVCNGYRTDVRFWASRTGLPSFAALHCFVVLPISERADSGEYIIHTEVFLVLVSL